MIEFGLNSNDNGNEEQQIEVDLAQVLFKLGFLSTLTPTSSAPTANSDQRPKTNLLNQFICTLEDKEQKSTFKKNLFTALAAI